jgi:hypothetical protein
MNGQLEGERASIGRWRVLWVLFKRGNKWSLYAALVCSCLLHAGVFLVPYYLNCTQYVLAGGVTSRHKHVDATLISTGDVPRGRQDFSSAAGAVVSLPAPVNASGMTEPLTKLEVGESNTTSPAAGYYLTSQLTRPPRVLNELEFADPEVDGGAGKIILKLWINASGEVEKIDTQETDLTEILTKSIVGAFQKLRFKPGELYGLPVGVVMTIEVDYQDGLFTER